jgi:putative transposase
LLEIQRLPLAAALFRADYNTIRHHSALKGMTPTKFAQLRPEETIIPVAIHPDNEHQSSRGLYF